MTGIQNLNGKRVLITGASRGLGVLIAKTIAAEGAELILAARDGARLESVAKECRATGAKVAVVPADVSTDSDRHRLIDACGPLDVLVNNAAIENTIRFAEVDEAELRVQLETNLHAPLALCRLVLPGMLARRSGVIVNVSSMSGKTATPFNAIYTATKHGLNGFTAAIAMELEGTGVHAGVVCPSFVSDAGMWADAGSKAPAMMREVSPEKVARGVLSVIRGQREVLVTPMPVRPILSLVQLFPSLESRLVRRMGVFRVFEQRANQSRRGTA